MDESAPDLRAATLSGVKWTSAARLLAELAMFAASIVLARLISPAEFGFTVVAVFAAAIGQSVAIQGDRLVPRARSRRRAGSSDRAAVLLCLIVGPARQRSSIAGFALAVAPSLFGDRAAELHADGLAGDAAQLADRGADGHTSSAGWTSGGWRSSRPA